MGISVLPISLGCSKNQVDFEIMLKALLDNNFTILEEFDDADIAIINTCAFIEDAKKEAIENILEMADYKEDGIIKKIIVTGCLAQRYKDEIFKEIPEVDAILGIGANSDIVSACYAVMDDTKVKSFPPKENLPLSGDRMLITPKHFAYLRISDGCSNNCSYCAIPSIRGKFRSREIEDILSEAETLVKGGVRELILIAQDTTLYGKDIYGEIKLPKLLTQLAKIENLEWIRLLYCYPDKITDELLEVIKTEEKVLNYLDIPFQHADEKILKAMNRKGSKAEFLTLVQKIRSEIPDIVLRTTLITGFPFEGEEEFTTLSEFVNEAKFDHLGCFAYSKEEGTKAALLSGQVDAETAQNRSEIIMEQQYNIVTKLNEKYIGKTLDVVMESYEGYLDCYYGRAYINAPEIDSIVIFTSAFDISEGEVVSVKILAVAETGYDLLGEAV